MWSINNFFYLQYRLLSTCILVFTFLIYSCTPDYQLSGTLYCDEGIPLKGVKVLLCSDFDQYPETTSAITETATDGSFKFNAVKGQSYLLEVHGDLGAGRLYIPSDSLPGDLEINYPVTEKIVFLHTNDKHFDLNNLQELTRKIDEIRRKYENVFLLSAGDIFVRHPHRWIDNGQLMENPEWYGKRANLMINTMNELGYDLLTLGNHEVAYIENYTRNALELASFPLLAANISVTTEKMPPLNDYSFLKTKTLRKIAVLGLTCGSAEEVKQLDISETVQKYMPLKDSADIFLALTHIGLRRDNELAENFPGFDLIIGGHSHSLLEEAILVNGVLIAQAGGSPHFVSDDHPVFLGKTIITLENGIIKEKSGRVFKIEGQVNDSLANGNKINSTAESEVEAAAAMGY